jgi:ArsR family transcriptional regulator, arsenate/arsenite/antimonite-responsive transcriptional repressor
MKDAAQFFKVLSDEARLQILWLLFNHEELCVCDIMAALDITQSKASRHLITLKHAGLVKDRKDGLWSHYSLCAAADDLARQHLDLLQRGLGRRTDAASLLKTMQAWLHDKQDGCVARSPAQSAKGKTSAHRHRLASGANR